MKLISTWNPKGGQGKSLLAINLAGAAVAVGMKPVVVDLDPQGTAIQYAHAGFPILPVTPETPPECDVVIFDEQASDWTLPTRKTLVMPVRPSRDQFRTFSQAHAMAKDNGCTVVVVCTGGDIRREMEREIVDQLVSRYSAHVLPDSGIYTRAADEYTTVFDKRLSKVYGVVDARLTLINILADAME